MFATVFVLNLTLAQDKQRKYFQRLCALKPLKKHRLFISEKEEANNSYASSHLVVFTSLSLPRLVAC